MAVTKISILSTESIHCGFNLTSHIVHTVLTTLKSSTYVLISDQNIQSAGFVDAFVKEFNTQLKNSASDSRFLTHIIPPGELTKSRAGKAEIEDWLLEKQCTRDTVLLALGGGVVGDLIGFVAATFMRGVRYVQIPTTLLAMVDSSVGGKTAIDTPHGKNLLGAFWQPSYIFIDPAFLSTLPEREVSNGMAEIVKTAAIWDASEFSRLENGSEQVWAAVKTGDASAEARDLLLSVIMGSIRVKAHIVTIDPHESGLRNLVNFGHSIGHAIEAMVFPNVLHGECVAIGMILEAELARAMGVLDQAAIARLTATLKAYGLPVSLKDERIKRVPSAKDLTVDRILERMAVDKKNSGKQKKIVILNSIGSTLEQQATVVPDALIRTILAESVVVVAASPSRSPVTMSTPGSKSISNRALVLAALGKGNCRLRNLLHSDDTRVMMSALADMEGAQFTFNEGDLLVEGGAGQLHPPRKGKELYLGNAGTAARFLASVATLVQRSDDPTRGTETILTGNARMKQRPIGPLVDSLRSNGCQIDYLESQGCLPLVIAPSGFKGGHIQLAASVSSQYVSSILMCAPYAQEAVTLELVGGQVISQPYIDMTLAMMAHFGVHVTRKTDAEGRVLDAYSIPKSCYVNPKEYAIESDASSATYPLAIAGITGTTCTIQNIGSASLQGDAGFAEGVLKRMGCAVTQTANETTVDGKELKAVEEIDMEPMTDAFLTATVLGAVAGLGEHGTRTTRIIGIANQRVKECDRIGAMRIELAKFGVQVIELPDGLEVTGKSIQDITAYVRQHGNFLHPNGQRGVSVHCYDDHRVAMAFSVLATVIEGTVIEEKRCVEKTWPGWWDDLANKIGVPVEGVESAPAQPDASSSNIGSPTSSVLLIGMRGTGKTHIGLLAASALSFVHLDADAYLEKKHGTSVADFVRIHGWPAFRDAECAVLEELLNDGSDKATGHVISLGGGIVESPRARELLKTYAQSKGPVVHVSRDVEEVIAFLEVESERTGRPAYGEPIRGVCERREQWFMECADWEYVNTFSASHHEGGQTRREVERFFKHVTGQQPNLCPNVGTEKRSYFLSLTYPSLTPSVLSQIDELSVGVDALEVRVDLLRDLDSSRNTPTKYVSEQIAALRRVTSLPIVFTVRTVSQGGAFPDNAQQEALELLRTGLRLGVEYLDVELSLPETKVRDFVKAKGSSQIIASWHDWSGKMTWDGPNVQEKYDLATKLNADIVKIVGRATSLADNFALEAFRSKVASLPNAKPLIAINMGSDGQLSRILNVTLTPVTHPLLNVAAAPGQLSFAEIQSALHLLGQVPKRKFYLFGSPIAHSLSPTLHNTAFDQLGLPHRYELLETEQVDEEIKKVIRAEDFGGASVTIPHKLSIIPLLDELSPAAKAVGAVNTIVPLTSSSGGKRILFGDNTDVDGIRVVITSNLPETEIRDVLLIGAGGTARAAIYAFQQMGVGMIHLFNRSKDKAVELQRAFPDVNISILDDLGRMPQDRQINVIVSTVPAYSTTTAGTGDPDQVGLHLPRTLFAYTSGVAVVLDMAYKPAATPLLVLARDIAKNWIPIGGVEALIEQGIKQSEIWTGRRCPRSRVVKRVFEFSGGFK